MKTKLFSKTLLASALTLAMGSVLAAPYEIIDLGKIEGGTNSFAYGINDSGEVVGHGNGPIVTVDGVSSREYNSHGVQFIDSAGVDLGALDGAFNGYALAINNSGFIIGYSDELRVETDEEGVETEIRENFGVQYISGVASKLPGLESLQQVRAFDINNNGMAVGVSSVALEDDATPVNRGFVVNAVTGSDLVSLPSLVDTITSTSSASSINDLGTIVGWSAFVEGSTSFTRAFMTNVTDSSALTELPNLGTAVTMATDVNNMDVIVGTARLRDNALNTVAFVYDLNSGSELVTLPFFDDTYDNSSANAINDNGQIVGQALISVPTSAINTGFIYEDGELKDLNNLLPCNSGWVIDNATNINNMGEIIGYGLRTEIVDGESINEVRAFKLIPTAGEIEVCAAPEEEDNGNSSGGSWSLFGLSIMILFGLKRRKPQIKI